MEPKKKFSEDVQKESPADKSRSTERKYDTCRLNEERKEEEKKDKSGNKATDDTEWS